MNAQEILQQYETLREAVRDAKLPTLESKTYDLSVKIETLTTVGSVYSALDSFKPSAGWLDYQSGKQLFLKSPLEISTDYDMLLNVEVANSNASLHVRYNGQGGWLVTRYDYNEGNDYLADTVKHFASFDKTGNTTLQYLRFWKIQEDVLGVNPVFACFTGFGGKS